MCKYVCVPCACYNVYISAEIELIRAQSIQKHKKHSGKEKINLKIQTIPYSLQIDEYEKYKRYNKYKYL